MGGVCGGGGGGWGLGGELVGGDTALFTGHLCQLLCTQHLPVRPPTHRPPVHSVSQSGRFINVCVMSDTRTTTYLHGS